MPRPGAHAALLALLVSAGPAVAAAGDTPISAADIVGWKAEHLLVAAFCLLGVLILTFEFVLFLRARDRVSANDVMRGFSVTLILVGVVALLGIGYDEKQVQPAIALFGTLLGYLLGRGERREFAAPEAAAAPRPSAPPASD
ncbi:hypothetical protein E2C06_02390 [Dankookia rubra]|uniref:Uncharacterized protein n=1 Tax=Dankookia rubra TaxID=1442381 RepID=A0A4R5QL38_9PROT|nr:hypothetical protein [Dankookia rubra]TDH64214.1 hypothetical protein E2C06_02390 [Dankookia rubra]